MQWHIVTEEEYNKATDNGKNLRQNGGRLQFISNANYFMMMAPPSMFKHEDLVREGNELKEVVWVDDPVCLKPVPYGFLIAAKWGEEAAIERLQNSLDN